MFRDLLTRAWRRLSGRSSDLDLGRAEELADPGTLRIELYSDDWLQATAEENWARVPYEKRKLCVEHLRSVIPSNEMQEIAQAYKQGWPIYWHSSGGMAVRNNLRKVMKDDELPPVKYDSGHEYRNWDDFYMAALRQAVAPKDGEA